MQGSRKSFCLGKPSQVRLLWRCVHWNGHSPTAMKVPRKELPAIRRGNTEPVHSMAEEQRELQLRSASEKLFLSRTTTIETIWSKYLMAARSSSKLKSGISLGQKVLNPVASSERGQKMGNEGDVWCIYLNLYIYINIYLLLFIYIYI